MFNVGNAFVTVAPRFNNFQGQVRSKVRGTMPQVGNEAGRELGQGIGKGAQQGVADEMPALKRAAESAGATVSKSAEKAVAARDSAASATGRLRVAEEKLKEIRNSGVEGAKLAAAEERVEDARRKVDSATRTAENSQRDYVTAMKQSTAAHTTLDSAMKQSARVAEAQGRRAGGGFMGRMRDRIRSGASGVKTAIQGSLANTAAIGTNAGSSLGGAFMGTLTRTIAPLAAILGGGAIIGGGFNRLANIEDAEAKLTGLGNSAKTVETAMTSALESVQGTAFGLDEAATVGAGLIAAGIKPGKELEDTLRGVADSATIAGTDMGTMGSVWNKVAANGKLQGDEIMMLADRGIPIMSLLSKSLGKTTEEVRKMVSNGEIDFATFSKAMQEGMGGAALKSGETTRGTLRNVTAAVSRFGANLLEHVFPLIKSAGAGLIAVFDNMGVAAEGAIAWLKENWDWLGRIVKAVLLFGGAVAGLIGAVKIIMAIRGAWMLLNAAISANWVVLALGAIIAALVWAYTEFEWFRDAVDGAMSFLGDVFGRVVDGITGIFDILLNGNFSDKLRKAFGIEEDHPLVTFLFNVRDGFERIVGFIQGAGAILFNGDFIGQGIMGIDEDHPVVGFLFALRDGFEKVVGFIQGAGAILFNGEFVGYGIMGLDEDHPVVGFLFALREGFLRAVDVIGGIVMAVFTAVGEFITGTLGPVLLWLWENVVGPVFQWIGDRISGVWNGIIKPVFDLLVAIVQGVVGPILMWLWNDIVSPVFGFIGAAITWAWNGIIRPIFDLWVAFFRNVLAPIIKWLWENIVRPVFDSIGRFIDSTWKNTIQPILKALADFIVKHVAPGVERGIAAIRTGWDKLTSIFAKPINWVIRVVWNNGIVKMFNALAEAVGSKTPLGTIPEIGLGDSNSKKGNTRGGGGVTTVGRRAAGGHVQRDRPYMVGELGPEMIIPGNSGWVMTAAQTAALLAADRDLPAGLARRAAGRSPSEALAPMGEFNGGAAWDEFKRQTGIGRLLGTDQLAQGAATIGNLASTAKAVLDPLLGQSGILSDFGGFGGLMKGAVSKIASTIVDWATGKDKAATAAGVYGGSYTGDPSGFNRPVGGSITSRFGKRWGSMHSGIDLAVPIGTIVRAAWSGVVKKLGWNALTGRTGKGMVLDHGGGRASYYGHLSGFLAKLGQVVKGGDPIARSGNTGRSTGPHVHFEELRGGRAVNPGYLFRDGGGSLPPGLNMVLNGTGKREWVFNDSQLRLLDSAVSGAGAGRTTNVYVDKSLATADDIIHTIDFSDRREGRR